MTRKWVVSDVINFRIYSELDIIEGERKKSLQSGAIVDRSVAIAAEMNFLRKEIEDRDGGIRSANNLREMSEERQGYLEARLYEEKQKGGS